MELSQQLCYSSRTFSLGRITILWFFVFGMMLRATAQVSSDVVKVLDDTDMTAFCLSEAVWSGVEPLPGDWVDASTESDRTCKELRSVGLMFGLRPQQVQSFMEDGKLVRIELIFLEAGNFFGFKKSRELACESKSDESSREKRVREAQIKQLKKDEDKEFQVKAKQFAELFKNSESQLTTALENWFGNPGKKVTVGQTSMLRSRVLEFATATLCLRLTAEDDQLLSLKIVPSDAASKSSRLSTSSGSQRRSDAKESVQTMSNGDVLLQGIPMVNQGHRGYCAMGVLAMIGTYYGLDVNIDQLAASAGYTEGDTENAKLIPIYEAVAKEGRMRMKMMRNFDFNFAMREIDKGRPLLVWRFFSRERDAFHHKFAADFAANETLLLPDPRKDKKDREMWPTRNTGGHASLITGYNQDRSEVLFTESWGEGNRHRRMRQEEMDATLYLMFSFEP